MSTKEERRRETRIQASATTFELDVPGAKPLGCAVVNLSRLGFGMELPTGHPNPWLDSLSVGLEVAGTLNIAGDKLLAQAVIRVRKDRFLGLEYTSRAADFITRLRALLTPQYVASSIHAIAPEYLGADIRAAYQSDDFECIIFKPGVSGRKSMVQIYWNGKVVEVVDDLARFVPPLLVRGGAARGADLLRRFSGLNDEGSESEMSEFFQSLSRLFQAWHACPLELQAMVKRQIAARP